MSKLIKLRMEWNQHARALNTPFLLARNGMVLRHALRSSCKAKGRAARVANRLIRLEQPHVSFYQDAK